MIIFHPGPDSEINDEITGRIESLNLAYATGSREPEPRLHDFDFDSRGYFAVSEAIDRLVDYQGEWYKFQSDSCYIDDDGGVC